VLSDFISEITFSVISEKRVWRNVDVYTPGYFHIHRQQALKPE